ncbi:MAG TPA: hypothetical protein VHJ40_06775 [Actinomycetota bacterium]|nr:hypothetical protein [Actinomycetota bacterium]
MHFDLGVIRGSSETEAIIAYLEASGLSCRVTSVVRSVPPSRHAQPGTRGKGLAIDVAEIGDKGNDNDDLAAIFKAFEPVESQLYELIYAGPQVSYNIKRGKRVRKYAVADHHDHVHVAVDVGVFIAWLASGDEEAEMFTFGVQSSDPTEAGMWLLAGDGKAHHIPKPSDVQALHRAGVKDAGELSREFLRRFERVHPDLGTLP